MFNENTFTNLLNQASNVTQSVFNAKAEASKADSAQKNYQASLNLADMAKSNTTKIAILGAVAVLVAFFIFKK